MIELSDEFILQLRKLENEDKFSQLKWQPIGNDEYVF